MNRHVLRLAPMLSLCAFACSSPAPDLADDFGYAGTGIGVTIAPLDLPAITDACYSFEITNGAPTPQRVVARGAPIGSEAAGQGLDGGPTGLTGPAALPICSSRFGNSQGAVSYVAPCDASPTPEGNAVHTVRLWVNSVCAGGSGFAYDEADPTSCQPLAGFVNPCGSLGCAVTATCVENADVPVTFNFTVMASAQQGFFDIAVNFDNVFCSAKLDTCYEADSDEQPASERLIRLLHEGTSGRQHTAVAAVACSAGTGETETTLHFSDLVVTCDGVSHVLNLAEVVQEGNLSAPNPTLGDLTAAVYYGTEALEGMNKVFTNVAFVIPASGPCSVAWTVVPAGSQAAPQPQDGTSGTLTQVAGVVFDPSVAEVSAGSCTNFSLNGEGPGADGGVVTVYLESEVDYSASLTLGTVDFSLAGTQFLSWEEPRLHEMLAYVDVAYGLTGPIDQAEIDTLALWGDAVWAFAVNPELGAPAFTATVDNPLVGAGYLYHLGALYAAIARQPEVGSVALGATPVIYDDDFQITTPVEAAARLAGFRRLIDGIRRQPEAAPELLAAAASRAGTIAFAADPLVVNARAYLIGQALDSTASQPGAAGQLRTATQTLAGAGLPPLGSMWAEVLLGHAYVIGEALAAMARQPEASPAITTSVNELWAPETTVPTIAAQEQQVWARPYVTAALLDAIRRQSEIAEALTDFVQDRFGAQIPSLGAAAPSVRAYLQAQVAQQVQASPELEGTFQSAVLAVMGIDLSDD